MKLKIQINTKQCLEGKEKSIAFVFLVMIKYQQEAILGRSVCYSLYFKGFCSMGVQKTLQPELGHTVYIEEVKN